MKCYKVREKDTGATAIFFAENASKAKYYAWQLRDDLFENQYWHYVDFFREVLASRLPKGDEWYKDGKVMMEWNIAEDRIILCRELGWYCLDETDYDCSECCARDFCSRYQEEKDT